MNSQFQDPLDEASLETKDVSPEIHHEPPSDNEPFEPCLHCGGLFNISALLPYGENHICPECKDAFFQSVSEGIALGHEQTWKLGNRIVVLKDSPDLPQRCIHCNEPGVVRKTQTLSYYSLSSQLICLFSFFFIGLFIIIPALILRKTIPIQFSYCAHHIRIKENAKMGGILTIGSGTVFILLAILFQSKLLLVISLISFLASLLPLHILSTQLKIIKADETKVQITGAKKSFLNSLLDWKSS